MGERVPLGHEPSNLCGKHRHTDGSRVVMAGAMPRSHLRRCRWRGAPAVPLAAVRSSRSAARHPLPAIRSSGQGGPLPNALPWCACVLTQSGVGQELLIFWRVFFSFFKLLLFPRKTSSSFFPSGLETCTRLPKIGSSLPLKCTRSIFTPPHLPAAWRAGSRRERLRAGRSKRESEREREDEEPACAQRQPAGVGRHTHTHSATSSGLARRL